jgi:hypothetical protein
VLSRLAYFRVWALINIKDWRKPNRKSTTGHGN